MTRDEIISNLEAVVRDVRKEPDEKMFGVFITTDEAEEIAKLPKGQEPKRGKWIDVWQREDPFTSSEGKCSVCGRISERPLGNFCRWCGAKMREDDYFV